MAKKINLPSELFRNQYAGKRGKGELLKKIDARLSISDHQRMVETLKTHKITKSNFIRYAVKLALYDIDNRMAEVGWNHKEYDRIKNKLVKEKKELEKIDRKLNIELRKAKKADDASLVKKIEFKRKGIDDRIIEIDNLFDGGLRKVMLMQQSLDDEKE